MSSFKLSKMRAFKQNFREQKRDEEGNPVVNKQGQPVYELVSRVVRTNMYPFSKKQKNQPAKSKV